MSVGKLCTVCSQREAMYRKQTICGPCIGKEEHERVAAIYAKREGRNR